MRTIDNPRVRQAGFDSPSISNLKLEGGKILDSSLPQANSEILRDCVVAIEAKIGQEKGQGTLTGIFKFKLDRAPLKEWRALFGAAFRVADARIKTPVFIENDSAVLLIECVPKILEKTYRNIKETIAQTNDDYLEYKRYIASLIEDRDKKIEETKATHEKVLKDMQDAFENLEI